MSRMLAESIAGVVSSKAARVLGRKARTSWTPSAAVEIRSSAFKVRSRVWLYRSTDAAMARSRAWWSSGNSAENNEGDDWVWASVEMHSRRMAYSDTTSARSYPRSRRSMACTMGNCCGGATCWCSRAALTNSVNCRRKSGM